MCINEIKLKLENQAVITLIKYTCKNYTCCVHVFSLQVVLFVFNL
jgi:hypothetical protein